MHSAGIPAVICLIGNSVQLSLVLVVVLLSLLTVLIGEPGVRGVPT